MKRYKMLKQVEIKRWVVFISLLSVFLSGCEKKHKFEQEQFLFNTLIKIIIYDEDKTKADKAFKEAFSEISRIDSKINNHSKTGEIQLINDRAGQKIRVTSETAMLLREAVIVSNKTEGAYDISIAPVFNLWNFDQKEEGKLPNEGLLKKLLSNVNYKDILVDNNEVKLTNKEMKIEAGSFLKGYAIEQAKQVLIKNGINSAFISAVSSIAVIGKKPDGSDWKIGVQNPNNTEEILKVMNIKDGSIGVSGDYQTYIEVGGKRYHHILNVKTGYPVEGKKMVVIIAKSCFLADLYSTAVFTVGIEKGLEMVEKESGMECLIIDSDMKEYYSKGFRKYIENKGTK